MQLSYQLTQLRQHMFLTGILFLLTLSASTAVPEKVDSTTVPEELVVPIKYYEDTHKRLFSVPALRDFNALEEGPLDLDFSPLWMVKQLQFGRKWPNNMQIGMPLGYVGDHFQRFQIHFATISQRQDNPTVYDVVGKTRVKGHVCDFEGTFTVKHVRLTKEYRCDKPTEELEEPLYGGAPVKGGIVWGEYKLVEDPAQLRSGVLAGMFVAEFVLTEDGAVGYNVSALPSDGACNNQFEGSWTSHRYNMVKVCSWGNSRIPNAEGLDIGVREFSASDQALPYGWQTYRDAYCASTEEQRKAALRKEQEMWWEDEDIEEKSAR